MCPVPPGRGPGRVDGAAGGAKDVRSAGPSDGPSGGSVKRSHAFAVCALVLASGTAVTAHAADGSPDATPDRKSVV